MENKDEIRLINIAKEIIMMTDSVIGVTGCISNLKPDDYELLKGWYESITGTKMIIPQNALKVREELICYLNDNHVINYENVVSSRGKR